LEEDLEEMNDIRVTDFFQISSDPKTLEPVICVVGVNIPLGRFWEVIGTVGEDEFKAICIKEYGVEVYEEFKAYYDLREEFYREEVYKGNRKDFEGTLARKF
jgi:hypothetical protein